MPEKDRESGVTMKPEAEQVLPELTRQYRDAAGKKQHPLMHFQ